ncbi:MAG: hypothetical protein ACOVP4_06740 [Bacteriovoracaceae bacterium]
MKSLILTLLIFSTLSQAAEVEVDWSCPQDNYPDIPQLEQQQKVKVIVDESGVKFRPNPFKPKIFGTSFFRSINPLSRAKKSLAIDYSACIDQFVADVKNKLPNYKNEWAQKVKNEIESKPFFAKTEDKKLLPTQWSLSKRYVFKNDQWRSHIEKICTEDSTDYLGADLTRYIDTYAGVTNAHPSKKCMESIFQKISEKISKEEKEYCDYSEKICKNLSDLRENFRLRFDSIKEKRGKAIKVAEEKFEKKLTVDKEAGFEDGFNEMFRKSGEDCAQYTTNIPNQDGRSTGETLKMHNLISKNLNKLMDHMDGSCQQTFIRKYMDQNNSIGVIGDWGIISHCKINETDFCLNLKDRFKIVEQNIERMLEKVYGKAGKDFYNDVACKIETSPLTIDELLGQLKEFDKTLSCRQLAVGESHVVDSNTLSSKSPTGVSMRYSLERISEKKLKARLNLNFKPNSEVNVSAQEMFNRAQSCMKDYSPYFKGPDGEVLEIDIINSKDAKTLKSTQRPPRIDISISGPDHRSNAGNYESDIDCPTIAHEVMHLMGLCDEYNEQWNGNYYDPATGKVVDKDAPGAKFVNAANCRVHAKIPSIMSDQNKVIDEVIPKAPICKCESSDCTMFTKASKKMQDLYLKDPWGISNGRLNSDYCSYITQAPLTLAQYESEGELLHLDKAQESALTYTIRYWDDSYPKQVQNLRVNCSCKDQNESCQNYLEQIQRDLSLSRIPQKQFCPSGTSTISRKSGKVDDSNGVVFNDDGSFTFNGGWHDENASLLHPQHFERIASGTCPEKAKPYSSCAQFAYKTDPSGKCPEVPKECQDPKYFLGTGNKQ